MSEIFTGKENMQTLLRVHAVSHSNPARLLNGNRSNQPRMLHLLIKKRKEEGRELLSLYLQHGTLMIFFLNLLLEALH